MKKPNLPQRSKRKNLTSASKSNIDAKLTETSIILEYAFERHVNLKERVILISGDIDKTTFELVDSAMTQLESMNRSSITIKINSPGGEVYNALAIVGRLKKSKCRIITEGYGHVMSASTLILACGNLRLMSKYSFFMHHETSYELEGRHSQIKSEVAQTEKEEKLWCKWMEEFSKKDQKWWKKSGIGTNAYFTAEDLLKFGVIDEIF